MRILYTYLFLATIYIHISYIFHSFIHPETYTTYTTYTTWIRQD